MNGFKYIIPFGEILITEHNGFIKSISTNLKFSIYKEKETKVIKQAYNELIEYFEGKRKQFDLPLEPDGTEFQKKVWNALKCIPYGKTVSYSDIAREIGNEKAMRAVGGANGKNPLLIVVPCHRVVASGGGLGGYSAGIEIKKMLLDLENTYRR